MWNHLRMVLLSDINLSILCRRQALLFSHTGEQSFEVEQTRALFHRILSLFFHVSTKCSPIKEILHIYLGIESG